MQCSWLLIQLTKLDLLKHKNQCATRYNQGTSTVDPRQGAGISEEDWPGKHKVLGSIKTKKNPQEERKENLGRRGDTCPNTTKLQCFLSPTPAVKSAASLSAL